AAATFTVVVTDSPRASVTVTCPLKWSAAQVIVTAPLDVPLAEVGFAHGPSGVPVTAPVAGSIDIHPDPSPAAGANLYVARPWAGWPVPPWNGVPTVPLQP